LPVGLACLRTDLGLGGGGGVQDPKREGTRDPRWRIWGSRGPNMFGQLYARRFLAGEGKEDLKKKRRDRLKGGKKGRPEKMSCRINGSGTAQLGGGGDKGGGTRVLGILDGSWKGTSKHQEKRWGEIKDQRGAGHRGVTKLVLKTLNQPHCQFERKVCDWRRGGEG